MKLPIRQGLINARYMILSVLGLFADAFSNLKNVATNYSKTSKV
jgi:hypothetical protein